MSKFCLKLHKQIREDFHVLKYLTLSLDYLFEELKNMPNKNTWHKKQTSNKEIHLMFQIEIFEACRPMKN